MKFKASKGVGALIISPTRELSQQISSVLQLLAEAHGFSYSTLTGGTKAKQADVMRESVLVVGTPGRVLQALTESGSAHLPVHNLKVLILDEADRLLDNGTLTQQLRQIISHLPTENVQKILVSATVTEKSAKLAKNLLSTEFIYVSSEKRAAPATGQIKQNYLLVESADRLAMLVTVLRTLRKKKVIVFFSSCQSVSFHYILLSHFKLPVYQCMGQEKQKRRNNMYAKFVELDHGTLLTTAMAERGWDIPGVQWIIQYDPPHKPEDYIHRIGRTGRGEGQGGQALIFLQPHEKQFVNILKNMEVKIDEIEFCGELKDIQDQIHRFVAGDFAVHQVGKVAYKKFVRAYQCHKLKKIFNIHSLNLNDVCKAFGFVNPPMDLGRLT
ncbi:hypothetical protein Pcinc_039638 [Petrolisthes cinctipes]|uniref:ATP-dependent RNA helicase n=1 Tax=Petrolisthes cinctipes TaxID=88211 RepID=A0AAE1ELQ1_PETCI|nr:hypothetical protein Pcinc_039638 [Petrolisthes cinctipes]